LYSTYIIQRLHKPELLAKEELRKTTPTYRGVTNSITRFDVGKVSDNS